MRQRQHALDAAFTFSIEKVGVVAKGFAQDALPAGTMEERGLRAGHDKGIPRRIVVGVLGL